jgi:hypothetical protein
MQVHMQQWNSDVAPLSLTKRGIAAIPKFVDCRIVDAVLPSFELNNIQGWCTHLGKDNFQSGGTRTIDICLAASRTVP